MTDIGIWSWKASIFLIVQESFFVFWSKVDSFYNIAYSPSCHIIVIVVEAKPDSIQDAPKHISIQSPPAPGRQSR